MRELKADSLKAKWEVKHTDRLERGLLQIFARAADGKDVLVFEKGLKKSDLTKAKHELAWDGKYSGDAKNSKNGTTLVYEDMPYRVQVQGHTGIDEDNGLALAAMHTEVRLYVHPETRAPKDPLYDPYTAKASMALEPGPLVPGTPPAKAPAAQAAKRRKWFQYQLNLHGFPAGPVTGRNHGAFKRAIKEFQRSVPKRKVGAGDYQRMKIDGTTSADCEAALEFIEAKYKRKPFGNLAKVLASNNAPDLTDAEYKAWLPDVAKEIIVWADDRQYYTQGSGKDENGRDYFTGLPGGNAAQQAAAKAFGLENYRGKMGIADGKTDKDKGAVLRPWVPLKVEPVLLSKGKGLYDTVPLPADANTRKAMRRAIGPLRIDWTFDELPPDYSTIKPASYDDKYTRSRAYVAWAINKFKATHARKDTGRQAVYTNCKRTYGGIRSTNTIHYYMQAFGRSIFSLEPWHAAHLQATESIPIVAHDHLLASQQANKDLFEPLIGAAGVYFRPSNIAGDGYRVRAEAQFGKYANYQFPNCDALKARYPTPPQVHTAKLRVWRRSSFRGYSFWAAAAPAGHWPGFLAGFREHYRAAHVYFVPEASAAPVSFNITNFYNPATAAHVTKFQNIVRRNVGAGYQNTAFMSMSRDHVWPWATRAQFLPAWSRSPVNTEPKNFYKDWLSPDVITPTWRAYRAGLLYSLLREAEKQGYMRGHLFVEFKSSPAFFVERYRCTAPAHHTYYYIERSGSPGPGNHPCPAPGCAGNLQAQGVGYNYNSGMPLPAVGVAVGATWLFTSSNAETWCHEVGHHRHLEHAAGAPGAQYAPGSVAPNTELHDSEDNTTQNYVAGTHASRQDWDRYCIMSYASSQYPGGTEYFCGKCLLRNRGWKVRGLGYPGPNYSEP